MKTCEYCGNKARSSPCLVCQSFLATGEMVRWPFSSRPGFDEYLARMNPDEYVLKAFRLQDLAVRERVPWDSVFRKEGQP